jgi:hypothetical protein
MIILLVNLRKFSSYQVLRCTATFRPFACGYLEIPKSACGTMLQPQRSRWRALKQQLTIPSMFAHQPTMSTPTMSGICTKTLHPACALVGYTVITALVFAGLFASAFDMFAFVGIPTCMPGTTSTPYKFTYNATAGQITPITGPNAPVGAVPFCSSDVLIKMFNMRYSSLGYLGFVIGNKVASVSMSSDFYRPFCLKKSNGTCPTLGDQSANAVTVRTVLNTFFITNGSVFNGDALLGAFSTQTLFGLFIFPRFNNAPVTFGPSGTELPIATMPDGTNRTLDSSKTYYVRSLSLTSSHDSPQYFFSIAADTTSGPMTFTTAPSNAITATFPTQSSCANQQNVKLPSNFFGDRIDPTSINSDGSVDSTACGYCLTQPQQDGVLAVPGLCGATIALLLIMELMMCMPFVRKMRFFRVLVIVISVLCLIFLIAAVAGAAVVFPRVAQCVFGTDFSQDQLMPSPTGAPVIAGYTPSAGGALLDEPFSLISSRTPGVYAANQISGTAAYFKASFVPGSGAVLLTISIVLLFLFTIVFAIKTNWSAVPSDAGPSAMMEPLVTPR